MFGAHVFDVGQASCAVLELGRRQLGIIDCGLARQDESNPCLEFLLQAIDREPSTEIAFLLLSHLDYDHVSGLDALLAETAVTGRIRRVFCNDALLVPVLKLLRKAFERGSGVTRSHSVWPGVRSLARLAAFLRDSQLRDPEFHYECVAPSPAVGAAYPVLLRVPGVSSDFRVELWAPSQKLRDGSSASLLQALQRPDATERLRRGGFDDPNWNACSAVVRVTYRGRSILFPGDANRDTFVDLLPRTQAHGDAFRSDVVVAWHHGAKLARRRQAPLDAQAWRSVLAPGGARLVLVSNGCGNRYGHPDPAMVAASRGVGAEVMCTQKRIRADRADVGQLDAFDCGGAILKGVGSNLRIFKQNDGACCGHISVTVDRSGRIAVSSTRARVCGETGCCLSESQGGA